MAARKNSARFIEDKHQEAVFSWAAYIRIPPADDLEEDAMVSDYLFHIPNGGKRGKLEAIRLKKQGVKSGVSDMLLPIARQGYHGLWLELKPPNDYKSKVYETQQDWKTRMERAGYLAMIVYGFDEARAAIMQYLGIKEVK